MHDVLQSGQRVWAVETNKTYQLLQVFAVLTTQATISFPDPIPSWRMSSSCRKEDHSVVGLDYNEKEFNSNALS